MIVGMVLVSLLFHIFSFLQLGQISEHSRPFKITQKQPPIKIKIQPSAETPLDDADRKKIIETPLAKTAPPKDAKFSGATDHQTEKETRIDRQITREKAANAGQKGTANDPNIQKKSIPQPSQNTAEQKPPVDASQPEKDLRSRMMDKRPGLSIAQNPTGTGISKKNKQNSAYQKLLPSEEELSGQMDAGYQDYIDESIALGDRIDINTSEFKYISYFTSMRKAIELVWNYPSEAINRGIQGEVGIEFTIAKDGKTSRVKVIRSSGHASLDSAIVEAITLAAPFAPLPPNFGKERLTIQGAFRYVLTNYAGAH